MVSERDWAEELKHLLSVYSLDGGELHSDLRDFVLGTRHEAREEGREQGLDACLMTHRHCSCDD